MDGTNGNGISALGRLTAIERKKLADYEAVVEKGKQTFIEVGLALISIRDERLYREVSDDFSNYCQVRWGFTRRRAEQLINAADVIGELSLQGEKSEPWFASESYESSKSDEKQPSAAPMPENERQVRELGKSPEGARKETWDKAVATAPTDKKSGKPKVTAAHVRRVVKETAEPEKVAAVAIDDADDFAGFNAKCDEVISDLKGIHAKLTHLLGYVSSNDNPTNQWASRIGKKDLFTGAINTMVHRLNAYRPAKIDKSNSYGFKTVEQMKTAEAVRKAVG